MLKMQCSISQKLMWIDIIGTSPLLCNMILVVVNAEPRVEVMETTMCREGGTLHYECLYLLMVYN